MSKRFYYLFLIILSLQFFSKVVAQTKVIGILNLEPVGVSESEARTLTNRLHTELSKTRIYHVVEMAAVEEILKEQGLQQSGACSQDQCVAEVGNLLGVEWMLAGGVGRIGRTFSIDVRMIDVKSRRIVKTVSETYRGELEGLLDVMTDIAQKLSFRPENMPTLGALRITSDPEGVVVFVNDNIAGSTPITLSDLSPGTYKIQGKYEGYLHRPLDVEIIPGRFVEIDLNMIKLYNLRITSEPIGATLIVGGKEFSTTPYEGPLPQGIYQIDLIKNGYKQWTDFIKMDSDQEINVTLKRLGMFQPIKAKPKKKNNWLWIVAGVTVIGGGAAAAILTGKEKEKEEPVVTIGRPPNPPKNP